MNYINIIIELFLGLIIADILTGLFHWFEDSYFDYCLNIPILSEIAKDNILHHYYPRAIAYNNTIDTNIITFIITIFILLLLYIINPLFIKDHPYFTISLGIFGSLGNQFHKWSHYRRCELNSYLLFLQDNNIIASHEYHSEHHNNSTKRYCSILQINNYILDNIGFWRILEEIVYLITNVKPVYKLNYKDYDNIKTNIHRRTENSSCPPNITSEELYYLKDELVKYYKCKV